MNGYTNRLGNRDTDESGISHTIQSIYPQFWQSITNDANRTFSYLVVVKNEWTRLRTFTGGVLFDLGSIDVDCGSPLES